MGAKDPSHHNKHGTDGKFVKSRDTARDFTMANLIKAHGIGRTKAFASRKEGYMQDRRATPDCSPTKSAGGTTIQRLKGAPGLCVIESFEAAKELFTPEYLCVCNRVKMFSNEKFGRSSSEEIEQVKVTFRES
jgi:hypothetical protein